jgi:hypothetical protein
MGLFNPRPIDILLANELLDKILDRSYVLLAAERSKRNSSDAQHGKPPSKESWRETCTICIGPKVDGKQGMALFLSGYCVPDQEWRTIDDSLYRTLVQVIQLRTGNEFRLHGRLYVEQGNDIVTVEFSPEDKGKRLKLNVSLIETRRITLRLLASTKRGNCDSESALKSPAGDWMCHLLNEALKQNSDCIEIDTGSQDSLVGKVLDPQTKKFVPTGKPFIGYPHASIGSLLSKQRSGPRLLQMCSFYADNSDANAWNVAYVVDEYTADLYDCYSLLVNPKSKSEKQMRVA